MFFQSHEGDVSRALRSEPIEKVVSGNARCSAGNETGGALYVPPVSRTCRLSYSLEAGENLTLPDLGHGVLSASSYIPDKEK